MTTLRLALRNVFRHRARSLITLGVISFGCVAVIFMGGYFANTFVKMRESYIRGHTGHLQIYKQGFAQHGRKEPYAYLIDEPTQILEEIRKNPAVQSAEPRLRFMGLLSTGENSAACFIEGVEPSALSAVSISAAKQAYEMAALMADSGTLIEKGDTLSDDKPFGVLPGLGFAEGLKLTIGQGLVLTVTTPSGALNALDVEVQGVFRTSSKAFDDRFVRLPLATAQSLLNTTAVQSIVIKLDNTMDTERVKVELEQLFAAQQWQLEIKTWRDLNDYYVKTEALFNRMFLILKVIVFFIVILGIYNTMNMAVMERVTEVGTLLALGQKKRAVLGLILTEGLVLGAIGGGVGALCGIVVTWGVGRLGIVMPPPPEATMPWLLEPQVVPSVVFSAFCLSVMTATLSAYLPGRRAAGFEIAAALRHVN